MRRANKAHWIQLTTEKGGEKKSISSENVCETFFSAPIWLGLRPYFPALIFPSPAFGHENALVIITLLGRGNLGGEFRVGHRKLNSRTNKQNVKSNSFFSFCCLRKPPRSTAIFHRFFGLANIFSFRQQSRHNLEVQGCIFLPSFFLLK